MRHCAESDGGDYYGRERDHHYCQDVVDFHHISFAAADSDAGLLRAGACHPAFLSMRHCQGASSRRA